MRQKSPELDIPEGTFYGEITGYNVYVKQKDNKTGLLKDLMIYDFSNGFNNASVMVADSGRLKMSEDKKFLVLSLYNGESFANLKNQSSTGIKQTSVPYRRETFSSRDILIDFNANFSRTDESFMQNQYMGKNMKSLQQSIDSMSVRLDSIRSINATNVFRTSYRKTLDKPEPVKKEEANKKQDTEIKQKEIKKTVVMNYDSLFLAQNPSEKASLLSRAKSNIETQRGDYFFKAATLGDEGYNLRRHMTEWHNKFTVSFACLVFFFIGAPLGAIIRKGGLGVPVVLSVFLFIFYYIINNIGFKMARDGVWAAWQGMWLSSAVLAPLGIFLTYKAVKDSVILNADTYMNAFKALIGKRSGRKIERKEVIIFTPDYEGMIPRLEQLITQCKNYLSSHKRWVHYISFWKDGGRDKEVEVIADEMENIIEELGNSDKILVLNKLMDYPIISGYNRLSKKIKGNMGFAIAIFFPIGVPLYLLAIYQRKLLLQDMKALQKTSGELIDIIRNSN